MVIWYPDWNFYVETHQIMLEKYGGYPGILKTGKKTFEAIIEKVKAAEGDIYLKAGIMLSRLRRVRIVEDAHKRTAYTVTKTFLEVNDCRMTVTDPENVNKFMKDILKYNVNEIVEWIRNGKIPEKP